MTEYNVAGFTFRFLTCRNCRQEYKYTADGNGMYPYDEDLILWSFDVYDPEEEISLNRKIYELGISRCTNCQAIIWAEENVNTYSKKMDDSRASWDVLNNASRPAPLRPDEYFPLTQDPLLTEPQRLMALQYYWDHLRIDYSIASEYNDAHLPAKWPETTDLKCLEQLLPHLPTDTDTDKMYKAELLRNLGDFSAAFDLLKQVTKGKWKRVANFLIHTSRKEIAAPVIIPPRNQRLRSFKRWVNRKRPYTFRLNVLTMKDYF